MAPAAGAEEKPFADLPPQEPGVTLRVFDIQSPLSELCDLKPAQTPNVDKLIPTVDWSSTEGFGFTDNFVSQIIGNINVPAAGAYAFRLISDDGSRLFIGDQKVIDHDGLHGAEPKDGEVTLTPGYHALRIDHFDRGGEQQVTLQWKPPGADDFTLVPNSVLSTDAGVVRVTAPGRKECEGRYDTPGDGLPLTSVNPGYTLTDLRPEGFEPQVSAMDWMPGGRLAVTTWGGSDQTKGQVYVLDNVTGDTGPEKVTYKKIADGLKEPMGIKYVDGKLYVSEKHQLTELSDTDGDNTAGEIRKVAEWPYGGNFHEFAFGLLYEDGNFYLNLSVAINYGGATTDPQPAPDRGTTVKVNKKTGKVSYLAGGLRTPNGIGRGPEGELFVTDNQGGWLPASKLLHVKKDRFFNHHTNPDGPFDDRTVTKPVLWLPQNEIANSPSTPMLLKKGPFAGQMLFGDVTYGGIQRADLEKVDGEYQGAVFRHTQGLESGITRISTGPDGAIYAGGLGADGNWGQEGKLRFGLQKLTPNGRSVFDIKTMRATRDGFELTYTEPLSEETAAAVTSGAYSVEQWRYVPTPAYGGPKVDEEALPVAAARISDDRRKVRLTIPGLKTDRVVHVRSPRPFASADGEQLWSTEARTTPPRPVDVEAAFPELATMRRTATRLHPRRGVPTVHDSSVGGPLLWPADEPWPVCTIPHKRGSGYRYSEVVREREIRELARRRDPRGPTPEEAQELAGFKRGRHAPHLADTDPIPMLAVAQLYRRDVPGLPDTGEGDLLQVFWCGFERHGDSRYELHVQMRRRHSKDVGTLLAEQPVPEVIGRPELVPSPSVLHPEEIVEHPYFMTLDPSLQDRIDAWEGPEDEEDEEGEESEGEEGPQYIYDLSTVPGWKVGGYIAWNLTGPGPLDCGTCGTELTPLLTADQHEWTPGSSSWIPHEDRQDRRVRGANTPTRVSPGRGRLTIAVCPRDANHPIGLVSQ